MFQRNIKEREGNLRKNGITGVGRGKEGMEQDNRCLKEQEDGKN